MATTPKAAGLAAYGSGFRTVPELAKVHLLRGANRISDELHDGQGFLPQHLALSNEFEDVLQVLWRFRALDFPKTCDADEPAGGCHAACATAPPPVGASDDDADLAWWRRAVFENDKLTAFVPQLAAVPRGAQAAVARAVCATEWAFGDHAGAESPLDPSFWPMHPTLDRLLQYKRLVSDFDDQTWSGGSLCKYGATSPCLGHREDDLTAFKSHVQGDGAFVLAYLTNRELLNMTDPRSRDDRIYTRLAPLRGRRRCRASTTRGNCRG
ncbi:phosphatase [Aureococcus anophagefferens]|nr:phosphatase [Aureococcus anophagefferens]